MAARWKQWRIYFKDMQLTGRAQQMLGGMYISSGQLYFPKVYNIEMDPHEDLNLGGITLFMAGRRSGGGGISGVGQEVSEPTSTQPDKLCRSGRLTAWMARRFGSPEQNVS